MTYNKIRTNLKKLDIASSSQLEKHDIAFWWANKYKEIKANQYLSDEEKEVIINEINIARDELLEIEIEILKKNLKFDASENKVKNEIQKNANEVSDRQSVNLSIEQNKIKSYLFYPPLLMRLIGIGLILFSGVILVMTFGGYDECPFRDAYGPLKVIDYFILCEGQIFLVFMFGLNSSILFFVIGRHCINKKAHVLEISSKGIKFTRNFLKEKFEVKFISLSNIKKATLTKSQGIILVSIKKTNNATFFVPAIEKPQEVCNIINKLVVNNEK